MAKTPSSPVRVGVAGVGYLGRHHARVYAELPDCELAGVFDTNPEAAAAVAAEHGCRVFSGLDELAAGCEAVSVVVPTDCHADVAIPLLAAGCHLLIEKPLCRNLDEAGRILEAARAADAVVQVGHIEHYNPVMSFLEGVVRQPRYITADRLAPFQPRGTEVGVVLDLMIHDLGIILQLVGAEVVRVDSVGVEVLSRSEDIANARLTFANGCVANINASRVSQKKVREIRVFQPGGYLSIDFMNQKGHLLRMSAGGLERQEVPIAQGEPLVLELSSFLECVRTKGQPKVSADFGRKALELALLVTRQLRESPVATE